MAILGEPNPYIREFRDRAFHVAANTYFRDDLFEDEDGLAEALRTHLVEWINASFDDEGDLKAGPDDEVAGDDVNITPARSVKALEPAERMDMLRMAVLWLPIPESPDWTCPRDQASLRAVVWLTGRAASEGLWDLCRVEGRRLKKIDWAQVPHSVISIRYRWSKAVQLETAGVNSIARNLLESVLADEELAASEGTPESRRDVSITLERLADLDVAAGDHAAAKEKFEQCLEISEALDASLGTPESRRDLSRTLSRLADLDKAAGSAADLAAARKKYERCLEIDEKLAASHGTPESRRDVSIMLSRLADLDKAAGSAADLAAARKKYERCLEISEALVASLGTPKSERDVSITLSRLADLDVAAGDHAAAKEKFEQCLEISEALDASLGTPESRRDLSRTLSRLADLDKAAGSAADLAAARKKYERCLEIDEKLAASHGTPESRRDVSHTLSRLADLDTAAGSAADLAAARKKYERCLEIHEELNAELGTSGSRIGLTYSMVPVVRFHVQLGDYNLAQDLCDEAWKLVGDGHGFDEKDYLDLRSLCLHYRCKAKVGLGELDVARELRHQELGIDSEILSTLRSEGVESARSEFLGNVLDGLRQSIEHAKQCDHHDLAEEWQSLLVEFEATNS